MTGSTVRDAVTADATACAAIYAPFVLGTAVSFETEPPDDVELARRIEAAQARHAWLVAEVDDGGSTTVAGYAYGTDHRTRPAYRWSCEVSVYVAAAARGAGVGTSLYAALLERLAARGFRQALAAMTLPNPASAALHAASGFAEVGVLAQVGWKHGRWHDVVLLQRGLGAGSAGKDAPAETR